MTRSARSPLRLIAGLLAGAGLLLGAAQPALADRRPAAPSTPVAGLVIQVDLADHYSIDDVTAQFPVVLDRVMVRRSGIYRVHPVPTLTNAQLADLAVTLEASRPVLYAVPDPGLDLADTRFHSWPEGDDAGIGILPGRYLAQNLTDGLNQAHLLSRGANVRVAVLDTGVSYNQPALLGKIGTGYDYIDDDSLPAERKQGVDTNGDGHPDGSYGHGTFVAGLVSLVAPSATILPMRVLDSDGVGEEVVIGQAIRDAVAAGANIINLSFGTNGNTRSEAIDSALALARSSGVLVVVAAGNTGTTSPLYPASSGDALSVTSIAPATGQLATYASRGPWVTLAAPGSDLVGPLPDFGYARWSGTSMAAPIVSGLAALVQSAAPRSSLDQRVQVLTGTARSIGGDGNVRYGAVDILASVQRARR